MKRELILLTLLSLLLFPGIHASGSKSSSPALEVNIDWAKFMSEQDMIWEVLPRHGMKLRSWGMELWDLWSGMNPS